MCERLYYYVIYVHLCLRKMANVDIFSNSINWNFSWIIVDTIQLEGMNLMFFKKESKMKTYIYGIYFLNYDAKGP